MKKILIFLLITALLIPLSSCKSEDGSTVSDSDSVVSDVSAEPIYRKLSESALLDKIRGSWAGQMFGVVWGYNTEFKYRGEIMPESEIPDYTQLDINNGFFDDDLIVDVTYTQEMRRSGYNCDIQKLADAFAATDYPLDHANKIARTNLQNGIKAPLSGNYKYNIHCDDIDFQIVSDFVGTVYAADINSAIARAFEIGHITNYGDGVYGGVFMSAMHSAAYTANSVDEIIAAGVNAIPENTKFRKVTDQVIQCRKDGKTWQECYNDIQTDWGWDDRCLWYVPHSINIDAKLNSAYVLIGLLYGEGDMEKSARIAMQCGQDSDCNPSSVCGILGNYYGYKALEKYFKNIDKTRTFTCSAMTYQSVCNACYSMTKDFFKDKGYVSVDGEYFIPESEVIPAPYEQWEEMPSAELQVTENDGIVKFKLNAHERTGIKDIIFDLGDGTVINGNIAEYKYSRPGTYDITCTIIGNSTKSIDFKNTVTVNKGFEKPIYTDYGNLAYLGNIICTVTSPSGSGSTDLNVIRDGKKSGSNTDQYDTYGNAYSVSNPENMIGYIFNDEYAFDKVVFTEGMHFDNGGWFANGTLKIEAFADGKWKAVEASLAPQYPSSDSQAAFGRNFETYTFTFTPVKATGIRIIGTAGGSAKFIGVAELEVYGRK